VRHLQPLLCDGAARAAMQRDLAAVGMALRPGAHDAATGHGATAIDRAAAWALYFLQESNPIEAKARGAR
jgi:hypothetical protein